jgi:L-2-hydroxyglutarate oxidase LhgO
VTYDVCIVGAGLVGLGVGRALAGTHPGIGLVILDKEPVISAHQSSHNSGVAHSGLYYRPGSLKARLCVEGRRALQDFCAEEDIAFEQSGKLVIATRADEIGALDELERRGRANGLAGLRRLDPEGLREIEPAAAGIGALHVPEAGVVDFPSVAVRLADRLISAGADILTDHRVEAIAAGQGEVRIQAGNKEIRAKALVNCAGLHSDRVAALSGVSSPVRIVPFRGEYYTLAPEASHLVRALIYPVPDPRFPFLGVHFTRGVEGKVEVGPNAVLALGREHYRGADPDWADLRETLAAPGFRRLAARHWATGIAEMVRSRNRRMYARSARSLVPEIRPEHLLPGGAGVRAQAVSADGRLVDDFVIEEAGPTVHVLNAPSPGATASFAIGAYVAALVARHLET